MSLERAILWAKLAAWVTLTLFLLSAALTFTEARDRIDYVSGRVERVLTTTDRNLLVLGGVLKEVRETAKTVSKNSQAQNDLFLENQRKLGAALDEQRETMVAARGMIEHTDAQLNEEILPRVARLVERGELTAEEAQELLAEVKLATRALETTLWSVESLAHASEERLRDPELAGLQADGRKLLQSLDALAVELKNLSVEGQKTVRTGRYTLIVQAIAALIGAR